MRLLFQNNPYETGWIYGRWEWYPDEKRFGFMMHGSLDGWASDLREILEMEERKPSET